MIELRIQMCMRVRRGHICLRPSTRQIFIDALSSTTTTPRVHCRRHCLLRRRPWQVVRSLCRPAPPPGNHRLQFYSGPSRRRSKVSTHLIMARTHLYFRLLLALCQAHPDLANDRGRSTHCHEHWRRRGLRYQLRAWGILLPVTVSPGPACQRRRLPFSVDDCQVLRVMTSTLTGSTTSQQRRLAPSRLPVDVKVRITRSLVERQHRSHCWRLALCHRRVMCCLIATTTRPYIHDC